MNRCDKRYHLVCKNLTGNEKEVQPKSHKNFFCHSFKPELQGKGHGKSSSAPTQLLHETLDSTVGDEGQEINISRGCGHGRGHGCGCGHARGCCSTISRPAISDVDSFNEPSSTQSTHKSSFGHIIKKKVFDD